MTVERRPIGARFTSPLHHERVGAVLGVALGVTFSVCFVTGLYSHLLQSPPSWFTPPSRPAGLYRLTQGVHVVTGLASIPLLFAKLWSVFPKLFQWPPFTGVVHAVQRLSLVALVGGSVFELLTGLANINLWYPWSFGFRDAHYWVAWTTIGALMIHTGAQWVATRSALAPRARADDSRSAADTLNRRRFLASVFTAGGLVALLTVGETLRPLSRLALLAPRRPDVGPQGFPVNRTAAEAGIDAAARSPNYRLLIDGNVKRPLRLSLATLDALPQHEATLPIACVDGWSASKRWRGIRVRTLLNLAGAAPNAEVTVHSLQASGAYRTADLDVTQANDRDTLLALRVGGQRLHLDHGYPARLIGPNRPGVLQTKWVSRLQVR
jgi:hypothetical protein